MKLFKLLVAGALIPALVAPAIAADPVRPSVKPVTATPVKQDRSLVLRSSSRAGAKLEKENSLIGLPIVALLAGVFGVAAVVLVASELGSDEPVSPGS